MNPDSRVIRGINIATIVLSALGIFGGLALALLMGMAPVSLSDPSVVNALVSELQSSGSTSSAFDGSSPYSSYDFSGMTQDEAMAVAGTSIVLMVGLSLGYVVCKVVCLVAGILALRNCNNPAKLGGAFGWTIAAAIVSLLVGGMISLVLFVIMVGFARPIAVLMQAPEEAVGLTAAYIRICGVGIFFIVAYNVLSALLPAVTAEWSGAAAAYASGSPAVAAA